MAQDDTTSAGMPTSADAGMALAFSSLGAFTKGAQAIAVEVADYAQRSAQSTGAAWERLMAAETLENAVAVQTDYLNACYEDFVAEVSKLAALYVDVAKETCKETYKPFDVSL